MTLDGRQTTNVFTWTPPNTLTESLFDENKRVNSTVVRRFLSQGIDLTMKAKGVRAKSVFSRAMEEGVA